MKRSYEAWDSRHREGRGESSAFKRLPHKVAQQVDILGDDLKMLPRGAPELEYSIYCFLPAKLVPPLIGNAGSFVRSIENKTGAKVDIAREATPGNDHSLRRMNIVGPMLACYAAHGFMIQRLQEVERQNAQNRDVQKPWHDERRSEYPRHEESKKRPKYRRNKDELLEYMITLQDQIAAVNRSLDDDETLCKS
eukprot:TRINITY_DN10978_c3_g1_i1.p1 TRINITY_DN10978_c3_g1~~TRINITY_DN10978_c3_g1_i1.p1  ORF type:complete len:194 (-),score=28.36 TRINITY_DN10978_c3_g1_i1:223-804(-)